VTRNAEHALRERAKSMPESVVNLLEFVSEPLRVELHFEMYGPILSMHPFLKEYICECPHVMRRVCHSAMSYAGISRGDVLFNVGEIPKSPQMIIVSDGQLQYNCETDRREATYILEAGSWICEACIWVSWVHRGQLIATQYTKIFTLDANAFASIVSSFEHQGVFDPFAYANDFVATLDDLEIEEVNDLTVPHFQAQNNSRSTMGVARSEAQKTLGNGSSPAGGKPKLARKSTVSALSVGSLNSDGKKKGKNKLRPTFTSEPSVSMERKSSKPQELLT